LEVCDHKNVGKRQMMRAAAGAARFFIPATVQEDVLLALLSPNGN